GPVVARGADGDPEVRRLTGPELLDPAHEHGGHHVVPPLAGDLEAPARHRRIVLAVDEREGAHRGDLLGLGSGLRRDLRRRARTALRADAAHRPARTPPADAPRRRTGTDG